uniref:Rab-GAP TBC domain-containing protein n=1 Tax=Arcella intermedia TaxID=1963864 RepID=A0A6B2LLV2_9EUKA
MLAETITLLPPNFYTRHMTGLKTDVEVFKMLIQMKFPKLAKHFSNLGFEISVFVNQWFLCLYINTLPIQMSMRFLDCFFYDGSAMLFRVGLAILGMTQKILRQTTSQEELFVIFKGLPQRITDANLLFESAYSTYKVSKKKLVGWRKHYFEIVDQKYREKLALRNRQRANM